MDKAKHLFLPLLILLCVVLATAGCRKTNFIQNQSSPIPKLEKQPTDKQIEAAIIRAGAKTNWEIIPTGHRTMIGTLNMRAHQAVVTITFDENTYKITYKSSANLNAEDGKIHRNYNKWVVKLDSNIRTELATLLH